MYLLWTVFHVDTFCIRIRGRDFIPNLACFTQFSKTNTIPSQCLIVHVKNTFRENFGESGFVKILEFSKLKRRKGNGREGERKEESKREERETIRI